IALGAMSKYNYLLFAGALLVAGASLPALRPRVLSWRMLAALVLALCLLAPHLHWVLTHTEETLSRTFKFGLDQESALLVVWARGVLGFVISVASYLALAVAVFAAAAFFPVLDKADRPADRRTRLPEARAFIVRVLV